MTLRSSDFLVALGVASGNPNELSDTRAARTECSDRANRWRVYAWYVLGSAGGPEDAGVFEGRAGPCCVAHLLLRTVFGCLRSEQVVPTVLLSTLAQMSKGKSMIDSEDPLTGSQVQRGGPSAARVTMCACMHASPDPPPLRPIPQQW